MHRKPGTDTIFRRSLPEIGCLSQGLPRGIPYRFVLPPKTVKHPLEGSSVQPGAGGAHRALRKESRMAIPSDGTRLPVSRSGYARLLEAAGDSQGKRNSTR